MMQPEPVDEVPFRLAVCCYALLAAGLPICLGMAVTPWSPWGIHAGDKGVVAGLISGGLASVPIGLGLRRQPPWWRRWVTGSFRALIGGWVATLVVGLLYPLGLVPLRPSSLGSLGSVGWTGLVFLIVLAGPAWWLSRTLRHLPWLADASDARRGSGHSRSAQRR